MKAAKRVVVATCVLLLGGLAATPAMSYTLTTTVTTDGVQSLAGGTLSMACRASSSSPWGSCGSSVSAGTEVSIDAVANDGYWFMWFMTNPYLAGCSTTNWGWGYSSNPVTHCGFTMPSSNVNINAEFQLP
jgi:List-Bact-rpt repeat protein